MGAARLRENARRTVKREGLGWNGMSLLVEWQGGKLVTALLSMA